MTISKQHPNNIPADERIILDQWLRDIGMTAMTDLTDKQLASRFNHTHDLSIQASARWRPVTYWNVQGTRRKLGIFKGRGGDDLAEPKVKSEPLPEPESTSEYRLTPVAIAVHLASSDPIFGEQTIHVSIEDDGGGPFVALRDLSNDGGSIRLDLEALEAATVAARHLIAAFAKNWVEAEEGHQP